MQLREYQHQAIKACLDAWEEIQRPAEVLATGMGKTVIFSSLCSKIVRELKARPCILVHRDELVVQTVAKLKAIDSRLSIGIIKGQVFEPNADVVVASVQTLSRRLNPEGKKYVDPSQFTHIIVDEAHHASAASYLAILEHFGGFDPESATRVLGVSATLARSDGVGLGNVWQEVVFEFGAAEAIEAGWLCDVEALRVPLDELHLERVRTSHGDYSEGALGRAMLSVPSGQRIAEAILQHAALMEYDPPVLRRIISFAPTIEVAETWAADFNDAGIHTECVFGSTPPEVRRRSYERLAKGEIDCISSVMVLTEGFDLPAVEVAVIGRPTKSLPLYIQMVGRVLRPSPETGKQGALVLDVCGTMTDALVTLSDLRLPKRCKCECDCRYTDECGGACRCRPKCPVCDKYGWPLSACQHYGEHHTIRCIHHCRTPAKPKDLLDGEGFMPEGVEFDGASIELRATKLFDKPKKATKSWRMTYGGLPYLPTFDDDDSEDVLVFLFQESDETWTVGRGAKGAKNLPVEKGLNFSQAVALAESIHPYGCRLMPKLSGSASPGQVGLLQRNQIEVQEGLTKNEASLMIGDLIASQRTGWRR